jgi:hypothetical protein
VKIFILSTVKDGRWSVVTVASRIADIEGVVLGTWGTRVEIM